VHKCSVPSNDRDELTLTDGWRLCAADEKPFKPDPVVGTPVVTTSNGHGPYGVDHASPSAVNGAHNQVSIPHNVPWLCMRQSPQHVWHIMTLHVLYALA